MDKYLILKFRNAKLFRNDKKCSDFVNDVNGNRKRNNEEQYTKPITVYQVSNVLHALFGERPVPSLRKVLFQKNQYYFDKANKSYIRVDGHKRFNKSKQEFQYVKEFLQTKKSVYNSYNPNPVINWEIVKQYIGPNNIDWFMKEISTLIQNPLNYTFTEIRNKLLLANTTILFSGLKSRMLSGLIGYLTNYKFASQLTSKNDTALINNNGIESVIILSGEIIVPVSDDDIIKLSQSKGCATILDGGFVWIDSIKNENEISEDGFDKVCDISTKKY